MLSLEQLYEHLEKKVRIFAGATHLRCPKGCGDCCDHADTEATAAEAGLIARYLIDYDTPLSQDLAEIVVDESREACVFYNAHSDFHCKIYSVRPLICRAFGYTSNRGKNAATVFPVCPSMATSPALQHSGGALTVLFEPFPPVMEDYAAKVLQLNKIRGDSPRRMPLGPAVLLALKGEKK